MRALLVALAVGMCAVAGCAGTVPPTGEGEGEGAGEGEGEGSGSCTSDTQCQIDLSQEGNRCERNADCCTDGCACVIGSGQIGRCLPTDTPSLPCRSFGRSILNTADVDGNGVAVCIVDGATCDLGECNYGQ